MSDAKIGFGIGCAMLAGPVAEASVLAGLALLALAGAVAFTMSNTYYDLVNAVGCRFGWFGYRNTGKWRPWKSEQ